MASTVARYVGYTLALPWLYLGFTLAIPWLYLGVPGARVLVVC
jgi:hypothetical protein